MTGYSVDSIPIVNIIVILCIPYHAKVLANVSDSGLDAAALNDNIGACGEVGCDVDHSDVAEIFHDLLLD